MITVLVPTGFGDGTNYNRNCSGFVFAKRAIWLFSARRAEKKVAGGATKRSDPRNSTTRKMHPGRGAKKGNSSMFFAPLPGCPRSGTSFSGGTPENLPGEPPATFFPRPPGWKTTGTTILVDLILIYEIFPLWPSASSVFFTSRTSPFGPD